MVATEIARPIVLLVDDDAAVITMLTDALEAKGYTVRSFESGVEAERLLDEVRPDLIILDLALPDMNGLLVCADLRAKTETPIIICTATKQQDALPLAFKLGADDFVRKPFSVDELAARMEAALRRTPHRAAVDSSSSETRQRVGALVIDTARCKVTAGKETLHLTPIEYRLLCALASRPGEVHARKELAEQVWGYHDSDVGRSLDVHMRRLRGKLNACAGAGVVLGTLRGFGYQLRQEPEGDASIA
jgi:two-component system, OmpR family, response regulator MtrA